MNNTTTNNKSEHCNDCIVPLGMSYPASYTCWDTCECHLPQNTEGENPLLEKFNNPETIRKAAELGAEDQNKMADSLRKQEEKEQYTITSGNVCPKCKELYKPKVSDTCEACSLDSTPKVATSEKECACKGNDCFDFHSAEHCCVINKCYKDSHSINATPLESSEKECKHEIYEYPEQHCFFCKKCGIAHGTRELFLTPHESEDWEAEFDKQFEEVILDQEVRTVIPGIKKFISEVESKAYQRGREEGYADAVKDCGEYSEKETRPLIIKQAKSDILSLAVQEILATKDRNSAFMEMKNEKGEIEDWTLPVSEVVEIISGVMKK